MKAALRIIFIFASSTLLIQGSHSQIFDKTKGKNVLKLITQTANVYAFGNGAYTDRLTKAFNDYWKLSSFKVHDISKGLPALQSGSTVFMPVVVGLSVRDHSTSMNHPFYTFGEVASSGIVNANALIAAFPINGFHYEFDVKADNMYSRSLLRIPYIVYNLHDMLTHLQSNKSENEYFKSIEAKSSRIAGKTLLVPSDMLAEWDVNPNTTALMKANLQAGQKQMKSIMAAVLDQSSISYAGKYKVMSADEILKLEEGEDAGKYALFLPAIDNKKYIMVYDLKTKELLYYESVNMGMKIKEKDFDKLNKAAGL